MYATIAEAAELLRKSEGIIIFDAENEDEGDFVFPSETVDADIIRFMMNHCRGVICTTLPAETIYRLEIPVFQKRGTTQTGQTNFIYPVDHVNAQSGISCHDREMAIKALVDPDSKPEDFVIPGHQNLLRISKGGVVERQGHTESSSDLVSLAGFKRSATICEIIDHNGIPMRRKQIEEFATQHGIKIVLLSSIYRHFLHKGSIEILPPIGDAMRTNCLNSKVCVLSGGSSGIGKAIARQLKEQGCHVINLSRSAGCDITKRDEIENRLRSIPSIDMLINCAGMIETEPITEELNVERWKQHFEVNVFAPLELTRACLAKFPSKDAIIINICSPSAHKTRHGWSAYCSSKAAITSLTKNMAAELKQHRVFGISPSKTDTPMIHRLFPSINNDEILETDDVAELCLSVASQSQELASGEIYSIRKVG